MENIINLVTRLRRKNFVLSNENISKIVSRFSFSFNSKETRREIAAAIKAELNDPQGNVIDSTLPSEIEKGIMAFLVISGERCKIVFVYPTGQTTSTDEYKS